MEQYLAEKYVPVANVERETAVVRELAARADVELLTTVYVPEDELCFYLFRSESAAAVAALAAFERISPAVAQ